jgi:hypothetical protein
VALLPLWKGKVEAMSKLLDIRLWLLVLFAGVLLFNGCWDSGRLDRYAIVAATGLSGLPTAYKIDKQTGQVWWIMAGQESRVTSKASE